MWVFALEAGIAVLLLLGIVWVTWPRRRDQRPADRNEEDGSDD